MKEILKQAIAKQIIDNIEIISGKYFDKAHKEIKNIKQYISKLYLEKHKQVILASDLDAIINTVLNFNESGRWYDLPLVYRAKKLGPSNEQLPFDLDSKQLTIINRMVFHPEEEIMFITTGIGGSGKSTFLNIVKQLFDNDFSSASLSDLTNDFTIAEAVKHRLICSDELAKGELNLPVLKQLISKQDVFCNPKHQTGYVVKSQSALFYCCNKAPKIDITDTGILRRIVFYERNTKIKNPNSLLKDKVYNDEELLCILRNSLRFENNKWYNMFEEETHKYLMNNNNVYLLLDIDTYEDYSYACKSKGLKPYSEPNWEEIRELFLLWCKEDAIKYAKDDYLEMDDWLFR